MSISSYYIIEFLDLKDIDACKKYLEDGDKGEISKDLQTAVLNLKKQIDEDKKNGKELSFPPVTKRTKLDHKKAYEKILADIEKSRKLLDELDGSLDELCPTFEIEHATSDYCHARQIRCKDDAYVFEHHNDFGNIQFRIFSPFTTTTWYINFKDGQFNLINHIFSVTEFEKTLDKTFYLFPSSRSTYWNLKKEAVTAEINQLINSAGARNLIFSYLGYEKEIARLKDNDIDSNTNESNNATQTNAGNTNNSNNSNNQNSITNLENDFNNFLDQQNEIITSIQKRLKA